jgi:hypothetical protein
MKKKQCRICGKRLAEANKEDICFCHQEGMVIKRKVPVTEFTSHDTTTKDPMVSKPGDAGYNDIAYTEEIVGAVDEDGNIYEIDLGDAELRVAGKDVYDHPDQIINIEDIKDEI